jgi:NADP-dependent 3-hydroxy acid dehydrogenase YdfG
LARQPRRLFRTPEQPSHSQHAGATGSRRWRTGWKALLVCTHTALPLIEGSGGGDIVNLSSVAGRRADAGAAVYNMTKFGVHGFSEALRQEALHAGIRVTIVAPGFVETELQGHNRNPVVKRSMDRAREDIGEVLSADDVADAVMHALTLPAHVCINEVVVRPTRQAR